MTFSKEQLEINRQRSALHEKGMAQYYRSQTRHFANIMESCANKKPPTLMERIVKFFKKK